MYNKINNHNSVQIMYFYIYINLKVFRLECLQTNYFILSYHFGNNAST